jgi:CBS domain-containing protein
MKPGRSTLAGIGIGHTRRLHPRTIDSRGPSPAVWVAAAAIAVPAVAVLARRAAAWLRAKTVEDVMSENVVTIDSTASLVEAAQRMRDGNVGVLPMIENGRLRGVVTDRDLVVRGLARGADPRTTRVAECATDQPICARPEWSVDEAMKAMAGSRVGRLPVVDRQDRVIGVVTLGSLVLSSRHQSEALETAHAVSRRSARAI